LLEVAESEKMLLRVCNTSRKRFLLVVRSLEEFNNKGACFGLAKVKS